MQQGKVLAVQPEEGKYGEDLLIVDFIGKDLTVPITKSMKGSDIFLAMDEDGELYAFTKRPFQECYWVGLWGGIGSFYVTTLDRTEGIDWTDSVVQYSVPNF